MSAGASEIPRAALAYAARGWSVIPMQPQGKRPLVAWRIYQRVSATPAEVERWFQHWPDANVGLVTGAVSGLVVVDIDARHGGPDSVAELEARHGPLQATVEARSGGGGRHLYYRHPGTPVGNRVARWPGIDVRGDGGCIVAPPSLHPSGRRYAWVAGHGPDTLDPAPLPPLFAEDDAAARHPEQSRIPWLQRVRDRIGEGRRNDAIASLCGHLLSRAVDPDVVLELMLAWNRSHCEPPLPDGEVAGVVRSIARLHEHDADGH